MDLYNITSRFAQGNIVNPYHSRWIFSNLRILFSGYYYIIFNLFSETNSEYFLIFFKFPWKLYLAKPAYWIYVMTISRICYLAKPAYWIYVMTISRICYLAKPAYWIYVITISRICYLAKLGYWICKYKLKIMLLSGK